MRFLKTNTATRVTVGPFLDPTDGVTPKTGLTVTNDHLTLVVDDGGVPTLVLDAAATASGGNNDMVHITGDDAGFYDLELTAAQVNYVGRAMLAVTDATNHCPVFCEFTILPAVVYDALIGGSDNLDVSVTQWNGSAIATPDTAGYPKVTVKSGAGTGELNLSSGKVDAQVKGVDANTLTASALATDAVNEIVAAVLGTVMSEGYAANGGNPTMEQILFMIWSAIGQTEVIGTTINALGIDGVTTKMTFTTDDPSQPTQRVRAT